MTELQSSSEELTQTLTSALKITRMTWNRWVIISGECESQREKIRDRWALVDHMVGWGGILPYLVLYCAVLFMSSFYWCFNSSLCFIVLCLCTLLCFATFVKGNRKIPRVLVGRRAMIKSDRVMFNIIRKCKFTMSICMRVHMKQMGNLTKEEFVHVLRRQSTGFPRGSSKYRGVTLHKCGRWEARMGQFLGKKYFLYLYLLRILTFLYLLYVESY